MRRAVAGFLAVRALGWLTRRRLRADAASCRKLEFSSNTQRIGLRFSERIRDAWRRQWLRLRS